MTCFQVREHVLQSAELIGAEASPGIARLLNTATGMLAPSVHTSALQCNAGRGTHQSFMSDVKAFCVLAKEGRRSLQSQSSGEGVLALASGVQAADACIVHCCKQQAKSCWLTTWSYSRQPRAKTMAVRTVLPFWPGGGLNMGV